MWAMSTISRLLVSRADVGEGREVEHAGIGAGPGDDQLRLVLLGQPADLVDVDALVALA